MAKNEVKKTLAAKLWQTLEKLGVFTKLGAILFPLISNVLFIVPITYAMYEMPSVQEETVLSLNSPILGFFCIKFVFITIQKECSYILP